MIREKLQKIQVKRLVILNLPYFFIFYVADKGSWLYRHCLGESMVQRLGVMLVNFRLAFLSWLPSVALQDLAVGVLVAGALKLVVYYRSKNAKKFRQGVEYGSAGVISANDLVDTFWTAAKNILNNLGQMIPRLGKTGMDVVESLSGKIGEAVPQLKGLTDSVGKLADKLKNMSTDELMNLGQFLVFFSYE